MHAMTVRRLDKRVERHPLGHIHVYREDLEAMAQAVSEVGELRIRIDSYTATEPSDLSSPELPEHPDVIVMTAADAGSTDTEIEVEISRKIALVTLTEPNTVAAGVLNRIQTITAPRRRHLTPAPALRSFGRGVDPGRFRGITILVFAVLLVLLAPIALATVPERKESAKSFTDFPWAEIPWLTLLGVSMIFSIVQVGVMSWYHRRHTTSAMITNAYRADRPSFWQRTRDDWRVEGTMLAIGTILGGVIGYFVNQIT